MSDLTRKVFCPILGNPHLWRCLQGFTTSEATCTGCPIGAQRAAEAGVSAINRMLSQKLELQGPDVSETTDAQPRAPFNPATHRALYSALIPRFVTTADLRTVTTTIEGHSRGLAEWLEQLLQLGVVEVKRHGEGERLEKWRWKGLPARTPSEAPHVHRD